jgi:hypothetical protein
MRTLSAIVGQVLFGRYGLYVMAERIATGVVRIVRRGRR